MGGTGLEPVPLALSKTKISARRGTESGTLKAKDPDLAAVAERWAGLPEHIRRAIKELIKIE